MTPTCISIPARELTAGDWIAREGTVMFAHKWKGKIQVCVRSEIRILDPEEQVRVHIEDHGQEE